MLGGSAKIIKFRDGSDWEDTHTRVEIERGEAQQRRRLVNHHQTGIRNDSSHGSTDTGKWHEQQGITSPHVDPSRIGRHAEPLPPIATPPPASRDEGSYSDSANPMPGRATMPSHARTNLDHLAHAQASTVRYLREALQLQTDIDERFQLSQDVWRDEKAKRALLKDHVASITAIVKHISRELERVEQSVQERMMATHEAVAQLRMRQDAGLGRIGWTEAQQEHINASIREAVIGLQSVQGSHQVQHSGAQAEHTGSLSAARLAGLQDEQAALSTRLAGLEARLQQQQPAIHSAHDATSELERRLVHQELQSATTVEDLRRAVADQADRQVSALQALRDELSRQRREDQETAKAALDAGLDQLRQALQTRMDKFEQETRDELDRLVTEQRQQRATQDDTRSSLEAAIDKLRESMRNKVKALEKALIEAAETSTAISEVSDLRHQELNARLNKVP
ncbi:uncharacterized protein MONBRDRAFT_5657 [Monosiga brevicollis MX1]|uniref:Uncharacterized protein n=1 Tax=Monosiga brevicollis TaxID=81824 RepID=A9US28_MONBE|nr:uncharacterized protein MONBRDRAFT_5657 [Monosiga brevicollis MX1]EDQ92030.1 predicted protein [Monosiga brevicollis MX1]|eukprot:XP_001743316.1 hypothetical protein [Monosiga brevicollis MX1]